MKFVSIIANFIGRSVFGVRCSAFAALLLTAVSLHAQDGTNAAPVEPAAPEPPKLDYNSFDLISTRNMFDPSRSPRRRETPQRQSQVDSFTLTGAISSDKGRYAMFESSSSAYHKTLKPSDTIAGYTIVDVSTNFVKLAASSNQFITMYIGNQMRRRDGGPWALRVKSESGETETTPVPGASPDMAAKAATLNGAESDALKRLLLKRMQEK